MNRGVDMVAVDEFDRRVAWQLHVELATRISVVELGPGDGLLREALTSLHSLFDTVRELLRGKGLALVPPGKTEPAAPSVGDVAQRMLNQVLRPFLNRWHPTLSAYESRRPPEVDPVAYERAWPEADALRAELAGAQTVLREIAGQLADLAGTQSLIPPHTLTDITRS